MRSRGDSLLLHGEENEGDGTEHSGRNRSGTAEKRSYRGYMRAKAHQERASLEKRRSVAFTRAIGTDRCRARGDIDALEAAIIGSSGSKDEEGASRKRQDEAVIRYTADHDISSYNGESLERARVSRNKSEHQMLPPMPRLQSKTSDISRPTGIWLACRTGDLKKVRTFLKRGEFSANDVSRTLGYKTPLLVAASHGYADIIQLLLDHGADPNFRDSEERTAAMLAAKYGQVRVLVLLLNLRDVDVNCVDAKGESALIHAVIGSHEKCVESILKFKNVDTSLTSTGGEYFMMSALDIANERQDGDIIALLRSAGKDRRRRLSKKGVELLSVAHK